MTHPRMKVTITPRTVANPGLGATERCGSHGDRLGLSTCAVPRLGNVGQDARPSVEWREFTQEHPERVSPSSPGLGRRPYPGKQHEQYPLQPQRGCGTNAAHDGTPSGFLVSWYDSCPRVAAARQPWAGGCNAVGVATNVLGLSVADRRRRQLGEAHVST